MWVLSLYIHHELETEGRIRPGVHCFAPSLRQRELGGCRASPEARGGPDTQGGLSTCGLFACMRLKIPGSGPG
jgi:hypothetical protein